MFSLRLTLLFLGLGVVLLLSICGFTTWLSFDAQRSLLIGESEKIAAGQLGVPAFLQQNDARQLGLYTREQLYNPATLYAAIADLSGVVRAVSLADRSPGLQVPALDTIRQDALTLETGMQTRRLDVSAADLEAGGNLQQGWMPGFMRLGVTDIAIPIVSPLSGVGAEITVADLREQALIHTEGRSSYVVGYVIAGISHATVWRQVLPRLITIFVLSAAFVALSALLFWLYVRRQLDPLAKLSTLAENAMKDEFDPKLRFSASGEAKHIATLLNTMLTEFTRYRAHLNIDHKLLNLRVEEKDSQLVDRDKKLSKAITEVSQTREELQRMAFFDSLTGLPNRRLFTEQLNLLLRMARRNNSKFAVMFLDIDNFKKINDSLGHSAGDLLLREVGIRLSKCLRETDLMTHSIPDSDIKLSRLGGDEFTVILTEVDSTDAPARVATRMLAALAAPFSLDGNELIITPSIGIAIGPTDADNVEGLLKAADTAMYQVKGRGKNDFCFYSQEMKTADVQRLKLEADLRRAVERGELMLHYQPQVSVKSGSVVGIEALVRWQHPERGLIGPAEFIPMAEELGLMVEISAWTLLETCREIATLDLTDSALRRVGVNISTLAVSDSLVDVVREAVKRFAIDPSFLELELTESVLMESNTTSVKTLEELKKIGVGLAIDDFGTGYSSLSYLSHFPLDTLKIDRSFVRDFNKSASNASLVEAIIAMGNSLDLVIIAEGVETLEQFHFLDELKVNLVQGYLFSKPMAAQSLNATLRRGHFLPKIKRLAFSRSNPIDMEPA